MQSCQLFKMDMTDPTSGLDQRCKNCQLPKRVHITPPLIKSDKVNPAVKLITNTLANSLNQDQKSKNPPQPIQQIQQPTQNKPTGAQPVKVESNPITFKKSDSIEEPCAEKVYQSKEWCRQNVQMINSVEYPNLAKQLNEQEIQEQSNTVGNNLNKSENNVLSKSQVPPTIKAPALIKVIPPQQKQTVDSQPLPQQVIKQEEAAKIQIANITNSAPVADKPVQLPAPVAEEPIQIPAPMNKNPIPNQQPNPIFEKPKTKIQLMQEELAKKQLEKNSPPQIKVQKQGENDDSNEVNRQSSKSQMPFNPVFMMPGAKPPQRSKSSQQKEGDQEYLVLDRPMPHNKQKRQIDFA